MLFYLTLYSQPWTCLSKQWVGGAPVNKFSGVQLTLYNNTKHTVNMAYRKLTLLVVVLFVLTAAEGQTITESEPAVKQTHTDSPAQRLGLTLETQCGSDRLLVKDWGGSLLYTQLVLLHSSVLLCQRHSDRH